MFSQTHAEKKERGLKSVKIDMKENLPQTLEKQRITKDYYEELYAC